MCRTGPHAARSARASRGRRPGVGAGGAGSAEGRAEARSDAAHTRGAKAARDRADRARTSAPADDLLAEMERRRKLLLGLYELLEKRHLALALQSYGDEHNSVRERIWLGYHDRLHAADVRRALRMNWQPPKLTFLPECTSRRRACRRTRRCTSSTASIP